jgi:hypothetical protein
MSSGADRIARLEAEVADLRAKIATVADLEARLDAQDEAWSAWREATDRKAPGQRGLAEVVPLRRVTGGGKS